MTTIGGDSRAMPPMSAARRATPPAAPRPAQRSDAWLLAGLTATLAPLGFIWREVNAPIAQMWLLHGDLLLAIAWGWGPMGLREPRVRRLVLVVVAAFVAVGSFYRPLTDLVGLVIVNLVVAALAAGIYRWRDLGGSWVPRDPAEATWLTFCCFLAGAGGTYLGAFPGTVLGGTHSSQDTWAVVRYSVVLAISAHCVLPLVLRHQELLRFDRRMILPFLAVCAVCLPIPFRFPDQPLSWLLIVPAVTAGLTMTRRGAAATGLLLATTSVPVAYPTGDLPLTHLVPAAAVYDLILAFIPYLATILVLWRTESVRLTDELASRTEDIRAQNALLESVVHSTSDGLFLLRRGGALVLSNQAADRVLGVPLPAQVNGKWLETAGLHGRDGDRLLTVHETAEAVRRSGRGRRLELALAKHPDRRLVLDARHVTVRDEAHSLLVVRDISEQEARQHELEAFAGTVAHDLKGPLTAVAGWMDAARDDLDDSDPAAGIYSLTRAQGAARRMRELIDDYLAYAITREGELTWTDVVLHEVVEPIARVHLGRTEGARVEIDVPHSVHADLGLTRQLLSNLVGNAVKYAREGVPPQLVITSTSSTAGWVEVAVSDRGRGITPGDEERIFEAYARSDKDASAVQGIGLGLGLCRSIVARHGGQIWAENNPEGGATFRFTLPMGGSA